MSETQEKKHQANNSQATHDTNISTKKIQKSPNEDITSSSSKISLRLVFEFVFYSLFLLVLIIGGCCLCVNTKPPKTPKTVKKLIQAIKEKNVNPITMHCPSDENTIEQQIQGLQALQINIDGQTSINKSKMIVESSKEEVLKCNNIQLDDWENALKAIVLASRQEAAEDYHKSLSILVAMLALFGIGFPIIIALIQSRLNEKDIDKIDKTMDNAKEITNKANIATANAELATKQIKKLELKLNNDRYQDYLSNNLNYSVFSYIFINYDKKMSILFQILELYNKINQFSFCLSNNLKDKMNKQEELNNDLTSIKNIKEAIQKEVKSHSRQVDSMINTLNNCQESIFVIIEDIRKEQKNTDFQENKELQILTKIMLEVSQSLNYLSQLKTTTASNSEQKASSDKGQNSSKPIQQPPPVDGKEPDSPAQQPPPVDGKEPDSPGQQPPQDDGKNVGDHNPQPSLDDNEKIDKVTPTNNPQNEEKGNGSTESLVTPHHNKEDDVPEQDPFINVNDSKKLDEASSANPSAEGKGHDDSELSK